MGSTPVTPTLGQAPPCPLPSWMCSVSANFLSYHSTASTALHVAAAWLTTDTLFHPPPTPPVTSDAPEVGVDSVTVTSVTGDTAVLPCHVTGNPAPSYRWLREGLELTAGGVFSVAENGSLVISSVSKAVEGRFVCTGSNLLGSATSSVSLKVLGEWMGTPLLVDLSLCACSCSPCLH